jgi:hypothetical protein
MHKFLIELTVVSVKIIITFNVTQVQQTVLTLLHHSFSDLISSEHFGSFNLLSLYKILEQCASFCKI